MTREKHHESTRPSWHALPRLQLGALMLSAALLAPDVAAQGTPAWTTAALSQAREELAGAAIGPIALFAGGRPQQQTSDAVDIYDSASGTWRSAHLSEALRQPNSIALGRELLFAGGESDAGPDSPTLDIYDSSGGQWRSLSLTPNFSSTPRRSVTVGSMALFVGPTTVDVYDQASGSLSAHPLAEPRERPTIVQVGDAVVLAGGVLPGPAERSQQVDIFEATTRAWRSERLSVKPDVPWGWPSAAAVGSSALFAAGEQPFNRADVYDSATHDWRAGVDLPAPPVAWLAAYRGAVGEWITPGASDRVVQPATGPLLLRAFSFFPGDPATYQEGRTRLDVYDLASGELRTTYTPTSRYRYDDDPPATVVRVGDKVLVAGGTTGKLGAVEMDAVDVYDLTTDRWDSRRLAQASRQPQVVVVDSTALFLSGAMLDRFDAKGAGRWTEVPFPSAGDGNVPHVGVAVGQTVLFTDVSKAFAPTASAAVDVYDLPSGEFRQASLVEARTAPAAVAIGGQVVFAGGDHPAELWSDRVDLYDARTGRWSQAQLSERRSSPAATAVGSLVLVAGGEDALRPTDVVDVYDAATGNWSTMSLPQPASRLVATSAGTQALFSDGDTVDIFDAASDEWSTASLSQPRAQLAAASLGTLAVFAGGVTRQTSSDVVDLYDASTGAWSTATLSEARWGAAATAVGTRILVGGGRTASGPSDVVDVFDTSSGSWSTARLSTPRHGLVAATVGPRALFIGGIPAGGTLASDMVDVYDDTTGTWSNARLSLPRSSLAVAALADRLLIAGGAFGGQVTVPSNRVDIYQVP